VAVVAPLAFPAFWELSVALVLCAVLVAAVLLRDHESVVYRGSFGPSFAVLFTALLVAGFAVGDELIEFSPSWDDDPHLDESPPHVLFTIGATHLLSQRLRLAARRNTAVLRIAALGGSLLTFALTHIWLATEPTVDKVASTRSFYGFLQVLEEDADDPALHTLRLRHGRILHGMQFQSPERRQQPNSYYGPESGVALALAHHPNRHYGRPLRIGIVGLGVGTLAAFGNTGDYMRFYELNPDVLRLATGPNAVFTYLRDTAANVDTVAGDARLALERELQTGCAQELDVLVLDAFSSDAIPIHLLTEEAFRVYRAHLRDEQGVVAVHVSNRYLDLVPVLAGIAARFGLAYAVIDDNGGDSGWASVWVLLTRDAKWLETPAIAAAASAQPPRRAVRWTDDFSNLLGVLKRRPA
jgi:hypothetical protein